MKKRNTVDELIKLMDEAIREMQQQGAPIFIDVSINQCQNIPQDIFVPKKNNTSVDVLETEKNVYALLELPGMDKKDIALSCSGWALEVRAYNAGNIMNETVELPSRVNKTGMKATYKNGILEVVFDKSKKRVTKGEI